MGILSLLSSLFRGKTVNHQAISSNMHIPSSRSFEYRLRRAREEKFELLNEHEDGDAVTKIRNLENGHEYTVSLTKCGCDDYKATGKPCKHILFLAIQEGKIGQFERQTPESWAKVNSEGEFIPRYWTYYKGKPTGLGYSNLYPYSVVGRRYGISEKTGKKTNRKATVKVNAFDRDDAIAQAKKKGVEEPFAEVKFLDYFPSEAQYNYLHGVEIAVPNIMNQFDVSALLTRYEKNDNELCPGYLFDFATELRIAVSYFASPSQVISHIIYDIPYDLHPGIYCYCVYCRERWKSFGEQWKLYTEGKFDGFEPDEKSRKYIERLGPEELVKANKNAKAYKEAVDYIRESHL